jgi:hypothetical protein
VFVIPVLKSKGDARQGVVDFSNGGVRYGAITYSRGKVRCGRL